MFLAVGVDQCALYVTSYYKLMQTSLASNHERQVLQDAMANGRRDHI